MIIQKRKIEIQSKKNLNIITKRLKQLEERIEVEKEESAQESTESSSSNDLN